MRSHVCVWLLSLLLCLSAPALLGSKLWQEAQESGADEALFNEDDEMSAEAFESPEVKQPAVAEAMTADVENVEDREEEVVTREMTGRGGICLNPFYYNGQAYHECIVYGSSTQPWCVVAGIPGRWAFCTQPTSSINQIVNIYTESGARCVLPFTHENVIYMTCVTSGSVRPWCYTSYAGTRSFCTNQQQVVQPAIQPVIQPVIQQGGSYTERGERCGFPFYHNGQYYSTCVAIGSTTRSWCAVAGRPGGWGFCRQPGGETSVVQTSNMNTESGQKCVFPVTHLNVIYSTCITVGGVRPFCYTSYTGTTSVCTTDGGQTTQTAAIYTETGEQCMIPFFFNGQYQYACVNAGYAKPICFVAPANSGRWGYCRQTVIQPVIQPVITPVIQPPQVIGVESNVLTVSGTHCFFPFEFEGKTYYSCTMVWSGGVSAARPWCSTTATFTAAPKFDYCRQTVIQPVIQPVRPVIQPVIEPVIEPVVEPVKPVEPVIEVGSLWTSSGVNTWTSTLTSTFDDQGEGPVISYYTVEQRQEWVSSG